ncbi:MAG: ATP-binding protein [Chloroflexi bacterium]|nr:ATP-binding protein [Chloroflexota bacterium]MCL5275434.1 ATP-binding protein [Chloroflexota bacterium]
MFISIKALGSALKELEQIHTFYLLTFLVCKEENLPVGETVSIRINHLETEFLEKYFKPDTRSEYFFRASKVGMGKKRWLDKGFAGKGSQKSRTTTFSKAFLHDRGTDLWGWAPDYLTTLRSQLQGKLVPAFWLSLWLYRDREWPEGTLKKDVIETFKRQFHIGDVERQQLFNWAIPSMSQQEVFCETLVSWQDLKSITGSPPDALPEEGGTLSYLKLTGVGPSTKGIEFYPAERLSLITGDNGLGKTFLLECAWWAMAGNWAGLPALPHGHVEKENASISFTISGIRPVSKAIRITYDIERQEWPTPPSRPTIPGLLVYARVDGSFSVWDPARDYWLASNNTKQNRNTQPLLFKTDQVWEGLKQPGPGGIPRSICNGLLADWITWQRQPDQLVFDTLKKVLKRLSPPSQSDIGILTPGEPTRIPFDSREIPTIRHPYGEIPIVHAAAGIRRIIAIAYLVVWAWIEHKVQSRLLRRNTERRMVILVDEMEAHLHPQWQRAILPALLNVSDDLSKDLEIQFLVATHSPLVVASVEPVFDNNHDALYHLDLQRKDFNKIDVQLSQLPFIRHGQVNSWLMSDAFGLRMARSLEAEEVIEKARALQEMDNPNPAEVRYVTERLTDVLAIDDEFWPRWVYFAEKNGVTF